MHLAVDGDRFGFDLTSNLSVFTDRQNAVRVDVPFDFTVDEQFFLELIEPLISTSLERMSLPPWSAIGLGFGFGLSIMVGFDAGSSRLAR